jgi:nucleoside-diphosphate-sugar epimerase
MSGAASLEFQTLTTTRPIVLVTGATGFIGQRCLSALADAGCDVHAIHRQARPPAMAGVASVRWHRSDLLQDDPDVLIAGIRPTHLLNLAWIATPGIFWSSPENLRWLQSGLTLAGAFYRHGGERALGVGTCAEYRWVPEDLREYSSLLAPDTIYGKCKLAMSQALEATAECSGRRSAWARLFFPYGPGEPSSKFISAIIGGLIRGERVACTDGHQVRDFLFIDDVADALVTLLLSNVVGPVNVASGAGVSLREIAAKVCEVTGADPALLRFGERQAPVGDPARVVGDTTRLCSEVGWRPQVGLDAGIRSTIAYWRQAFGVR